MSIHDWTRVDAGIFHDFHNSWITHIKETLNDGLLPPDVYALGEQVAGGGNPDVIALRYPASDRNGHAVNITDSDGGVALLTAPPQVSLVAQAERENYTHRQRTITIRHTSDHRILAMIEIVSSGNKSSSASLQSVVDKSLAALRRGIHLLLIDLYPPGPRDPNGIHGVIWGELEGAGYVAPADRPLTLVAYNAGEVKTAYVEPTAVGLPLLEMPLFLTPDGYINVPLEGTYQTAFAGVPKFYRDILG